MIGKIATGNPQLRVDYNNNYEITFPVSPQSKFAVRQVMNSLQKNEKELAVTVDYKDVVIINKGIKYKGKLWAEVKCIIGSSNEIYDTKRMADLIDGILDDMAEAGVTSATKFALEEEWRTNHDK